jgi:hypothetical protein
MIPVPQMTTRLSRPRGGIAGRIGAEIKGAA